MASFFRVQPIPNQLDWSLVRDLIEVLVIPYALFVIIGLIAYRSSKRMVVRILCLVVSFVVCAYTLFTYVRVFLVWGSDPKATNLFFSTPLLLLVGGLGIFVVGGFGIAIFSRTKVLQ